MLVLSRKPTEALVLPSLNAKITILEIKGRLVRIGIEAPDGVRIMRSELLLSLDDNTSAGSGTCVAANPQEMCETASA